MAGGAWRALRLRAGVPAVRMHDLRHTAASLMLSRGVHPKIVSEMLGHSTVAITLDLYAHATPAIIARLRAPWIRCSARPES